MAVVSFPDPRENRSGSIEEEVRNLRDAYSMLKKKLTFLLGNLDAENVVEAASVIADWIYANEINADQINGGTITGIAINGVTITGSAFNGGNISVTTDLFVGRWIRFDSAFPGLVFSENGQVYMDASNNYNMIFNGAIYAVGTGGTTRLDTVQSQLDSLSARITALGG
jgi:hypothetical protein